ncbi:hypothetical protein [Aquamicrobium terrae]|uniref:Uncharacterized protein n=1 Tax=Aquamicrobium terrae TaxID=1324945 RepID=A0ABV2N3E6_9HYPH
MTTHTIAALPGGQLDPDLEVLLAGKLPMTLRRVERTDERASDYQIDIGGWVDFGFGWSRTALSQESPTSPSWSNTGSAPGFRAPHDNRRTTKDGVCAVPVGRARETAFQKRPFASRLPVA